MGSTAILKMKKINFIAFSIIVGINLAKRVEDYSKHGFVFTSII